MIRDPHFSEESQLIVRSLARQLGCVDEVRTWSELKQWIGARRLYLQLDKERLDWIIVDEDDVVKARCD